MAMLPLVGVNTKLPLHDERVCLCRQGDESDPE